MCSFATRSDLEFNLAMLRFVSAQAGLMTPQPRNNFSLSASHNAETRAALEYAPASLPSSRVATDSLSASAETRTAPGPINQINKTLDALAEKPGAVRE